MCNMQCCCGCGTGSGCASASAGAAYAGTGCGCPLLRALENLFSTQCGCCARRCVRTARCCVCGGVQSTDGFGACSGVNACSDEYYARQYGLGSGCKVCC